jgi:hypothetical protein
MALDIRNLSKKLLLIALFATRLQEHNYLKNDKPHCAYFGCDKIMQSGR